jgi:uncharacterized protein
MKKTLRTLLTLFLAFAFASAASAQQPPAQGGLPTPAEYIGQGNDPAPPGTLPWQILAQAKTVQKANKKFGPEFTAEIRGLDKQSVKLYGFMMPLDQSAKQKRFLLSPFPPHCSFCSAGGPETMVEVIADKPFDFTYEPIVVAGRLAVLDDDIVYYRLTNASPAKP